MRLRVMMLFLKQAAFFGGVEQAFGDHLFFAKASTYEQDFDTSYPGGNNTHRYGKVGIDEIEVGGSFYFDTHLLSLGASRSEQKIDYMLRSYGAGVLLDSAHVDKNIATNAVYAQDEISLMDDRLILVPGVRFEDHDTYGTSTTPKLSVLYKLAPQTNLRFQAGKAFKSPTIRQLYYPGDVLHGSNYDRSNPNLKPEKSTSYHLSLDHFVPAYSLWLHVGVFQNDVKDMVVRENTSETIGGLVVRTYRNTDKARIRGAEFNVDGKLEAFGVRANAAVLKAENISDGAKKLPYTPEFIASITPYWESVNKKTGASIDMRHVGEQFTNATNTAKVKSYNTVDVKLWRNVSESTKIALEVSNVFDEGREDYDRGAGRYVGLSFAMQF